MREEMVRGIGLALVACYSALIVWVYVRQPQTAAEVTGGISAAFGAYRIDEKAFEDALRFFRLDQFEAAQAAFERADPARQDARTQFYIGYTCYRQGWGRIYHDDRLFARGLEAVNRAIELDPRRQLVIADPSLEMHSADELKAELEAGLRREASDLNPLRMFQRRK